MLHIVWISYSVYNIHVLVNEILVHMYIHLHDIVRMLCHDTCILFPYKSVGLCWFIDAVCDVLCLSFSPRQPDHFLAGCSDGSLRLYHTKRGMYKTSHSMLEVTT